MTADVPNRTEDNQGSLPAFPIPIAESIDGHIYNAVQQSSGEYGGLTKRELFAAMAMQGLAATWDGHNYGLVMRCVEVADALLKALAPPPPRPPACGKEFAPGQICVSDAGHEGECDDVPY